MAGCSTGVYGGVGEDVNVGLGSREGLGVAGLAAIAAHVIFDVTAASEGGLGDVAGGAFFGASAEVRAGAGADIGMVGSEVVCRGLKGDVAGAKIVTGACDTAAAAAVETSDIVGLGFFAWCSSTCLCSFVLLGNLAGQRRHTNASAA